MRIHWRFVLPVLGWLLFGVGTHYFRTMLMVNSGRYFYWSSIRLDRRPLEPQVAVTCNDKTADCAHWEPIYVDVHPGPLAKLFMLSAFPAFAVEFLILASTKRLGVNEVTTFMVSMPLLIAAWLYSLGSVIEHRATRNWFIRHWPIAAGLGLLVSAASVESEIFRAIAAATCIGLMIYQWLVYRRITSGTRRVFSSLFPLEIGLVSTWLGLNVIRFYSYDPENAVTLAWHERLIHFQDFVGWVIAALAVIIVIWTLIHLAGWLTRRIFRKHAPASGQ